MPWWINQTQSGGLIPLVRFINTFKRTDRCIFGNTVNYFYCTNFTFIYRIHWHTWEFLIVLLVSSGDVIYQLLLRAYNLTKEGIWYIKTTRDYNTIIHLMWWENEKKWFHVAGMVTKSSSVPPQSIVKLHDKYKGIFPFLRTSYTDINITIGVFHWSMFPLSGKWQVMYTTEKHRNEILPTSSQSLRL